MRTFAYIIVPLASYLVAHSNAQILSALFGSSPSTTSAPPAALLPSNSASAPNVLSIPTLPTALSLPSALSLPTALTLPTLPTLPSLPSLPSLSLPISLPFPTPTIAPNAFKPNAFRPATNPLLSALGLPQLVITIQWLPPPPGDNSVEHRILTLTHISSDKVLIAIRFNIGRGLARVISGLDDLIPGLNLGDTLGRSGPGVGRRQDVATLSNLLSTTSDSGFIFGMATEIVNRMIQPVVEVTEVEVVKMYAMPVNGSGTGAATCGNGTSMEWVPMMGSETIGAGSTILTGTGTSVPMTVPGTCNGTEIPMTVGTGSSAANATGTSVGLSMQTGAGAASALSTASMSKGVGAASALSTASMSMSFGAASALSTVARSGAPLSMQSGMPAGTEATLGTIGQGPANTGAATPTAAGVGSDSGSGSTSGSGSGSANGASSGSSVAGSSSNSGSSSGPGSDAGVGTSDAGSNSGSNSASGVNNGNGVGNGNGAGNSNGAGTSPPTPLPTAPPAGPSANSIPQHLFYVMTGPATRITRTVYRVTRSGGVATSTGA
ncbi:unnamed protein product [Zymoseptoria tritici ST99CH_3D7]|uniref:Uncharacterized protein n=1 Tax=Zymoseptoria tritici (strain ST99CH_3D7) TaxID=1276538 RepID=A0A1X7S4F3_ZYMT9|nr:unnamed protein product [Zymoseptoria tritici ST99CH_3D7]